LLPGSYFRYDGGPASERSGGHPEFHERHGETGAPEISSGAIEYIAVMRSGSVEGTAIESPEGVIAL